VAGVIHHIRPVRIVVWSELELMAIIVYNEAKVIEWTDEDFVDLSDLRTCKDKDSTYLSNLRSFKKYCKM
jgi:hypothetical protein